MISSKYIKNALLGFALLLFVSGCTSMSTPTDDQPTLPREPIEFIDLDVFDASMTNSMRVNASMVTVTFPNQPVTINEIPKRLQRWLSAVHNHGGGFTVETQEGYQKKGLLTVVGLLVSGYNMARDSMPALMGRRYKAVIVVGGAEDGVDEINFVRI